MNADILAPAVTALLILIVLLLALFFVKQSRKKAHGRTPYGFDNGFALSMTACLVLGILVLTPPLVHDIKAYVLLPEDDAASFYAMVVSLFRFSSLYMLFLVFVLAGVLHPQIRILVPTILLVEALGFIAYDAIGAWITVETHGMVFMDAIDTFGGYGPRSLALIAVSAGLCAIWSVYMLRAPRVRHAWPATPQEALPTPATEPIALKTSLPEDLRYPELRG